MFRFLAPAAVIFLASNALTCAASADVTPEQKTAICGARATCAITVLDAGQGPGNVKLTVAEARFGLADKPKDAPEEGCIGDIEATDAPERDGGLEVWLISGGAAPKRLLALCNDGYGASGVGEDQLEVTPNMLTWDQSGGSAWRWTVTRQIRLSPLEVAHEFHCDFNDTAPGTGVYSEVDRIHMRVRSVGYVAGRKFSDEDGVGCPEWPTGPDQVLPTGPDFAGGYAVPMPGGNESNDGLGEAYPDGIALGDCALELTTDGVHGFMIFGKPADAASAASLRVVKETEKSLLIQVYDPMAAAELTAKKAKTWVGQPHVEIWTAEETSPEDNDGENGVRLVFHQLAVGLDGQIYAGANPTDPMPKATRWTTKDEAGRDVTMLRLTWDTDLYPLISGLGVVYSQAKDGKQARLISNAQIKKNKPLYLPGAWTFNADESGIPVGSCALGADKLLTLAQPD